MKAHTFNIVVWKEGKYYVAQCLNTGISSFGESRDEALVNINEALELYFEDNKAPDVVSIEEPELIQSSFSYA